MPLKYPVTVIGAGLGGLVLASILYKNGIEVAVYDLESSPSARYQGDVLDMHEDAGQLALRKIGLYEAFRKNIIASGDEWRLLDKTGATRLQDSGNGVRPEIDRGALRAMLLQGLPAELIHWGRKLTKVTRAEKGGFEVTFADGTGLTTSLLVGADGAWSKVRPLVSGAEPIYLGVSFAETHLLEVKKRHPESATLVGNGSMFALSDEKGLLTHRDSVGNINVHVALKTPEPWRASDGIDFTETEQVRSWLLKHFLDWNGQLRALISESDTGFTPHGLYTLPIGHHWQRTPGVTLIGDAAHLMSPFAGEGANLAMLDGLDLAEAVIANLDDIETALATYEAKSFPRSKESASESLNNLNIAFRSDSPQGMIDLMNGNREQ
jgi:2-polyprenyl-6-methoxyphenol hydroxylase-like FAD-dependent oxidoreductase